MSPIKQTILTIFGVFTLILAIIVGWSSLYITPEGHVDVVKKFSKAEYVAEPGLNFKIPVISTTDTIEIRTRNLRITQLAAATKEQMPVTAIVSMNWLVKKESVLHLYKDYGSLEQFESRVIIPRFTALAKESISKYTAEEAINKRDLVSATLKTILVDSMKDLPIDISIVNIEDIALPEVYKKSIETKQTEKNLADAEVFKLQRQNLEAQKLVNTANAEADSIRAKAQAEAESISLKGKAEAEAIQAKARALNDSPLIVELTKAQNWDGALPTTVLGSNIPMLMQMPPK